MPFGNTKLSMEDVYYIVYDLEPYWNNCDFIPIFNDYGTFSYASLLG